MAGIFGNGNQGGMGILGAAQQTQPWQSTLGILASALKDATNSFSGNGGDTDNLSRWNATQGQNQIRQQLVAGLTSEDPTQRQQAYGIAPLFGIDPSAFQKQRAAQALPQLLTAMQPQQVTAPAAQADAGQYGQINVPAANLGTAPGMGFSEALTSVNNPELTSQYAPDVIKELMAPPKYQEAAGGLYELPTTRGEAPKQVVAPKPNYNAAFNTDGTPNRAYQEYEKNLRIAGRDGGGSGNVQSVQPLTDGTLLIVKRDGSTAHVTVDGQTVTGAKYDPNNHFALGAAGAAGKSAGAQAEAFPTVKANFGLINDTLKGFDDPTVKAQAPKAVGYGGYLPTLPGVNSDFRARQGQLQGQAFLQAFNTLKGGGQITEVEGEKATNAITRLQKSQTPDEFYKALHEAKGIFQNLYESARVRASRGAVVPAMQGGGVNTPTRAPSASKPPTVSNW